LNLSELEEYLNSILHLDEFLADPSKNGLQIQNSDKTLPVKKIAYAVDCCLETVTKAVEQGADVLLVHHGIFWNDVQKITGTHYALVKKILDADIALYAAHIPLDANKDVGNNYGLASKLGLCDLEEFGFWRGMVIGVKGRFSQAQTLPQVIEKLFPQSDGTKPLGVLPFGREKIETVGIISGGASDDVGEAIEQNLDLYITGEISHQVYHKCKENKINYIAGGHYNTETIGVTLLAKKISDETGIQTAFIDVPTDL